jgi:hypothetical protein
MDKCWDIIGLGTLAIDDILYIDRQEVERFYLLSSRNTYSM